MVSRGTLLHSFYFLLEVMLVRAAEVKDFREDVLDNRDVALLHEVWRARVILLESVYRLLRASRVRIGPYRQVHRLIKAACLQLTYPRTKGVSLRAGAQIVRVGSRACEELVVAGLVPSRQIPHVRPEQYEARLEASDWYARARAHGVPASALMFREEYRARARWGPWAPGDLALEHGKKQAWTVLVRAADLAKDPFAQLMALANAWSERCSLVVVVPDSRHARFVADLSRAGGPPVPVVPVSEVGSWLHCRWRGAENALVLARMVLEDRLGPITLRSALSEYPSFVASFERNGKLYGLCSLLDASEPAKVLSDLRDFRPSPVPGRYAGVVVVVPDPERAYWVAKRIGAREAVYLVPASHPKSWYRVRAGGLKPVPVPGGDSGG